MTDTRPITLGGRRFDVPPCPIRVSRVIYPHLRDLLTPADPEDPNSPPDILARLQAAQGSPSAILDDEWPRLEIIALGGAQAADKTFTREQFDDLPIKHTELIDAFLNVRFQVGVWVPLSGDAPQGEAEGA